MENGIVVVQIVAVSDAAKPPRAEAPAASLRLLISEKMQVNGGFK